MVVGFAGLQVKKAVPSFHWISALEERSLNRLYVRDIRQAFYQKGLPETGDNAGSVGEYLRGYVQSHGFDRIICLGGSAGGYAALLYGWFMAADEVHAFSPLARLPSRTKTQHVDRSIDRAYFDLAAVLAQGNGKTRYHIYFGNGHARDLKSSDWLAGLPGFEAHAYDSADHFLVTSLRDSGELARIIDRAVAG